MITIDHVKRNDGVQVAEVRAFVGDIMIVFARDRNGKISQSLRSPNKYISPADWKALTRQIYAIFYQGDRKKEALKA